MPAAVYQERIVLYADIVGWSQVTRSDNPPPDALRAFDALQGNLLAHEEYAQALKTGHIKAGPRGELFRVEPSPWLDSWQVSLMSDSIVISDAPQYTSRLIRSTSFLYRNLLCCKFLLRGAIVRGPLFHKGPRVYGPALVQAVEIEKEMSMPRVLVHDSIQIDERSTHYVINDQDNFRVVAPVPLNKPYIAPLVEDIKELTFDDHPMPNFPKLIAEHIVALQNSGFGHVVAKWLYLQELFKLMKPN